MKVKRNQVKLQQDQMQKVKEQQFLLLFPHQKNFFLTKNHFFPHQKSFFPITKQSPFTFFFLPQSFHSFHYRFIIYYSNSQNSILSFYLLKFSLAGFFFYFFFRFFSCFFRFGLRK